MDSAPLFGVILAVVRIGAFSFLCWGGWLTYTASAEPREEQPMEVGYERAGFLVLFALLWASLEGLVR